MKQAQYWVQVHHRDIRAVQMADRHYSRQHPGTPEFTRPGNKIVLLHFQNGTPMALWASQRPDPKSGIKRADGYDAWDCSVFRNEGSTILSSDLIREAVAITKGKWNDVPPVGGFITCVAEKKVEQKEVHGWCFIRAGWRRKGYTKTRHYLRLIYSAAKLQNLEPICAEYQEGERR